MLIVNDSRTEIEYTADALVRIRTNQDQAFWRKPLVRIRSPFRGTKDPWDDIETNAKLYRLNRDRRELAGEDNRNALMNAIRQNPPQDFSQIIRIIQLISEKPVIVTPLNCERCGANIPVPSSGQYVQCAHCGYNYHVTNVIEMLGKILSG